jgi:hypothetical protein
MSRFRMIQMWMNPWKGSEMIARSVARASRRQLGSGRFGKITMCLYVLSAAFHRKPEAVSRQLESRTLRLLDFGIFDIQPD